MDPLKFLKTWERHSGLYLVGEDRQSFLEECGQILYLEPKHLETALKTARQTGTFNLKYIEAIALNVRGVDGDHGGPKGNRDNVIDLFEARQRLSKKTFNPS
ncbi:MAG: hypothetical protein M1548_06105 [Actinobacteria bacterium]|nr:hypothetical protein [Actinomycetota bacterium]